MKNELNLTYLVPRTLYHNFRNFLDASQLKELDRTNMTYMQEPQASAILPAAGNTDDDEDTILPSQPTAPNPPVKLPKPRVEPPNQPVESSKPPAEFSKPLDNTPHAPDLFGEPERRGSWYYCSICGHASQGKEKQREHMLTHTSTPVQSIKPVKANHSSPQKTPKKTPKKYTVEVVKRPQQEEEPGIWSKYMKFTS